MMPQAPWRRQEIPEVPAPTHTPGSSLPQLLNWNCFLQVWRRNIALEGPESPALISVLRHDQGKPAACVAK